MRLVFKEQGKFYEIEISSLYYAQGSRDFGEELDYAFGQVYIDGKEQKDFTPDLDFEQDISTRIVDKLRV
jgi:hypothetical protein